MNEEFYFQAYALLKIFYAGIIIGFIYDSISNIIYFITKKISLSDVIFWIIGIILILNIFFSASFLSLRFYLLAGFVLGWGMYYFLVSPFYKKIFKTVLCGMSFLYTKTKNYANVRKEKIKIKYKKPITKMNIGLKRARKLPFYFKMKYNKLKRLKKDEACADVKEKKTGRKRIKTKEKSKG